jgi:hypothetical protein
VKNKNAVRKQSSNLREYLFIRSEDCPDGLFSVEETIFRDTPGEAGAGIDPLRVRWDMPEIYC